MIFIVNKLYSVSETLEGGGGQMVFGYGVKGGNTGQALHCVCSPHADNGAPVERLPVE